MGLFILFGCIGGLAIIGFVLQEIAVRIARPTGFMELLCDYYDEIKVACVLILIVVIIALSIMGFIVVLTQSNDGLYYAEMYDELIAQAETEADSLAYTIRVENYNEEIEKAKQGLQNPWINLFFSPAKAALPKIDLKKSR